MERERSSFPRFYFVGDEDLLEIMGNSKDISRLQKHLKKMFAGVTSIDVTEEDKKVKKHWVKKFIFSDYRNDKSRRRNSCFIVTCVHTRNSNQRLVTVVRDGNA